MKECLVCKSPVKFYAFKELCNKGMYVCQNQECGKEYYVTWGSKEVGESLKEMISRLSTKDVSHEMRKVRIR